MSNIKIVTFLVALAVLSVALAFGIHELNEFSNRMDIRNTEMLNAEKLLRQKAEDNASKIEQDAKDKVDDLITEQNKFQYGA